MHLDSETRINIKHAANKIRSGFENLARSVAEASWPLKADISIAFAEKVGGLHTAVADVLNTPEHAEVDTSRVKEAVVSLQRFMPELNAAYLTAAVMYMDMADNDSRETDQQTSDRKHAHSAELMFMHFYLKTLEKKLFCKDSEKGHDR